MAKVKFVDDFRLKILKSLEVESDNIIAIDPASATGWALSLSDYGKWDLSKSRGKNDTHNGAKWRGFQKRLEIILKGKNFDTIIYEIPVIHHSGAMIHHSKLVAIIELFCYQNDLKLFSYSPTEIKKFATGSGKADKNQMIQSAKDNLNVDCDDNDIVDAIWILKLHHYNMISK